MSTNEPAEPSAPTPTSARPGPSCLLVSAIRLAWALLLGVWLLEEVYGERNWTTCLLAYAPQHPFVLPPLALLPFAWRSGYRGLRLNVLVMLWFALFVLLGAQVDLPDPFPPDGQPLRVLTYNIGGARRGVGDIVGVVEQVEPDIVCLQEVDREAISLLSRRFRDWNTSIEGELAVLTRHEIYHEQRHQLERHERGVFQVVTIGVGGYTVDVINVHFMTLAQPGDVRGDPRGTPRRLRRTMAIRKGQIEALEQLVPYARRPTLVVGDFNTPPRAQIYRRLKAMLRDTFAEVGWGLGPTFRVGRPLWRIDYIWHTKGLAARRCWVPPGTGSDHRPVAAALLITERAP